MSYLEKLLNLFNSQAGLQGLRLRPGELPWVIVNDQTVVLEGRSLTPEETAEVVDEVLTPREREFLNRWGFISARHPRHPVVIVVELREGVYEFWCLRAASSA